MTTTIKDVATAALEQSHKALLSIPDDASPSQRSSIVTTAVRAITAYQDTHPAQDRNENEQGLIESPA